MSRKVLGLEIRAAAVAAVLLDSSFKGSVIEAQAFVPILPTGPMTVFGKPWKPLSMPSIQPVPLAFWGFQPMRYPSGISRSHSVI